MSAINITLLLLSVFMVLTFVAFAVNDMITNATKEQKEISKNILLIVTFIASVTYIIVEHQNIINLAYHYAGLIANELCG